MLRVVRGTAGGACCGGLPDPRRVCAVRALGAPGPARAADPALHPALRQDTPDAGGTGILLPDRVMELFLYREADTVLHRLDARTKILGLVAIFTVALLFSQPALQAGGLVAVLALGLLGRCLPDLQKLWVLLLF